MELIILGLLMIQSSTIYELRKVIQTNFTNISSGSMGSIQATISKLLKKDMLSFKEYVENGVNKKTYAITDTGKKYFKELISSPMQYKEKNMELGKLFFMGFTDKDKRIELIDIYISGLKEQLMLLEQIKAAAEPRYTFDKKYLDVLKSKGAAYDVSAESTNDIAAFQYATLDFSIAKLDFEIQWFETFKTEQLEGNEYEGESDEL